MKSYCLIIDQRKKIIFISLILLGFCARSQDSTIRQSKIIYKSWGGYKMDGKKLKEKELKSELYKVPDAIPYYQKSRSNNIIALAFIPPAALFALLSQPNEYPYDNYKVGFQVAAIVSCGISIFFSLRSLKFKKKAVSIYNKGF